MKMETAYRLLGMSGAVFGVFETNREADMAAKFHPGVTVEEYKIPYCMFIDMFNLAE